MAVHEMSPSPQALSAWMDRYVPGYVKSGYFPSVPFGTVVDGVRNEDAVRQTFEPETFDLVLHLDVLEHLFDPFAALREIHRTLKPGGLCLFTAPTVADLLNSFQVAFDEPGGPRIIGEPEYHGNPQRPEEGALVTWRYGYDLPWLISRHTDFDTEVRRFQMRSVAVLGYMTDVYILRKMGK
jgi:SAM-dependent methyltransferase